MNPAAARVLARTMISHVVLGDWALDHVASINYRTIGHQMRISRYVLAQNAGQIVRRNISGHERANIAAYLDERHYRRHATLQPARPLPFCLWRGLPPIQVSSASTMSLKLGLASPIFRDAVLAKDKAQRYTPLEKTTIVKHLLKYLLFRQGI
jgi:hypothetical protein